MTIYGKFTDYDIIHFDGGKEYIVNDYFEFLKNSINSGDTTNCGYDASLNQFSYYYNDNYYVIKLSDERENKDVIYHRTRELRHLLELMKIEGNVRTTTNNKSNEEKRKAALIEKAKNGYVETDEQRLLYLEYLNEEKRKLISSQFSFKKDYNTVENSIHSVCIGVIVIIALGVVGISVPMKLFKIGKLSNLVAYLLTLSSILGSICGLSYIFDNEVPLFTKIFNFIASRFHFIPNLLKGIIKVITKALPEIKIINHKIEWLKDYHLPNKNVYTLDTNQYDEISEDFVLNYINNIYLALSKLDDDHKKIFLNELLGKIKEYQDSLKHLKQGELTITNDYYVRTAFIRYLSDLEQRISSKAIDNKQKDDLDKVIDMIQHEIDDGQIEVVDGKVRRKKLSGV